MYTLYTDKGGNFQCEVAVKNASLKNAKARLVVETKGGFSYVFEGKIEGSKCSVPIRQMYGLLEKSDSGKMHLEVIVENTFFRPWETEYVVDEHTSIKVTVNENLDTTKPAISVSLPSAKKMPDNLWIPLKEISTICEAFGITKKSYQKRHSDFVQVLREYFGANPEFAKNRKSIIRHLGKFLK